MRINKNVVRLLSCAALMLSPLGGEARVAQAESAGEAASQNQPSPLSEVKATVDQLVGIVEKLPGDDNKTKRREALRAVIEPRFDFREMSKRSLGAYWNEISESEQKEFVDVFSKVLSNTYLQHIEGVKRDIVAFVTEDVDFPKALVKTTVENKGDKFPIDYKLVHRSNGWKVYDVVIENIGLVANYRNEFAGIIRKEKFTGLLERLKQKNA